MIEFENAVVGGGKRAANATANRPANKANAAANKANTANAPANETANVLAEVLARLESLEGRMAATEELLRQIGLLEPMDGWPAPQAVHPNASPGVSYDGAHAAKPDRKAYMRDLMRKKRAAARG